MHRKLCLYIVLLLAGACGKKPSIAGHDTVEESRVIRDSRLEYLSLTKERLDSYTFVVDPSAHCDSLLFTSLYLAAGGEGVNLGAAKDGNGLWERHPARDCDSTISKDMYAGLLTWFWHSKNLDEVRSLISAGETHSWVMGQGPIGKVILTPNMIATIYEMRYRLGGADGLARQLYTDKAEGTGLTGFEANLEVLGILLRGSMFGRISETQEARLSEQAAREPRNVLFQAAYHRYLDGNQETALALYPVYCPAGRLPTTLDRCNDYLWQRDESAKDWGACPKAPAPEWTFSGVDCEVAAAVIEGVL